MTTETEGAPEGVTEDTAADTSTDQTQETDAPAVEGETGDDGAAAPTEEAHKPKKASAQDRIDELTRARREAERDVEYWKAKALQSPEPKQTEVAPEPENPRPDPSAYPEGAYDPQFIEDLTDWKSEQAVAKHLSQRDSQTRVQTARQTFDTRAAEQFPDGEPAGITAIRQLPMLSVAIQDVIMTVPDGPKIADFLGSNPNELRRLSSMTPALQGRELAKIEARFATPAVNPAKTITDAPPATPQVRGNGGRFTVAADTSDFAAFEKQYPG